MVPVSAATAGSMEGLSAMLGESESSAGREVCAHWATSCCCCSRRLARAWQRAGQQGKEAQSCEVWMSVALALTCLWAASSLRCCCWCCSSACASCVRATSCGSRALTADPSSGARAARAGNCFHGVASAAGVAEELTAPREPTGDVTGRAKGCEDRCWGDARPAWAARRYGRCVLLSAMSTMKASAVDGRGGVAGGAEGSGAGAWSGISVTTRPWTGTETGKVMLGRVIPCAEEGTCSLTLALSRMLVSTCTESDGVRSTAILSPPLIA